MCGAVPVPFGTDETHTLKLHILNCRSVPVKKEEGPGQANRLDSLTRVDEMVDEMPCMA